MANETNIEKLRNVLDRIADLIREGEGSSNPIAVEDMRERLADINFVQFQFAEDDPHCLVGCEFYKGTPDSTTPEDTVDYYRKLLKNIADKLRVDTEEKLDIDEILAKDSTVSGLHLINGKLENLSLVIPERVTTIGEYAFNNCNSLTSVTIPNGVTTIGEYAFAYCNGLTSVTIPNGVTTIGDNAFANCTSLTSIEIPNTVTSIGNSAFYNCSSLTSIEIPSSVTSIGSSAFENCSNLTSLQLPNSVAIIGSSAFYNCSSLTSVTIPNSVTSIGDSAFYACSSLTSIVIPNSVTSIDERAFAGCSGLTSVSIPNSVTSIGEGAFYGCNSLNYSNYENCKYIGNLTNPYLVLLKSNNQNISTVSIHSNCRIIGAYAFSECRSLTSVQIPSGVVSIEENTFYKCSGLTSIEIPNTVTSIGDNAFANCSSLTSISIPNSVTKIGTWVFSGCNSLEEIELPFIGHTPTDKNTSFKSLFTNVPECLSSVKITGGSVIGANVFDDCSNITSIEIPSSITEIGENAFSGCSSGLNYNTDDNGGYYLGNVNNPYVVCISISSSVPDKLIINDACKCIYNSAFEYVSASDIIIPNSVVYIGKDAFRNGGGNSVYINSLASWCGIKFETYYSNPLNKGASLYLNNVLVTELTIPNTVTTINNYAFNNCDSLTSVTIPNGVTSIGVYAFYQCNNITSLVIGNSVTSIGGSAFDGCSLTSIEIPDSVTSIEGRAFEGCSGVTSVTFGTGIKQIASDAFKYCDNVNKLNLKSISAWCNLESYQGARGIRGGNLYLNNSLITHLVIPNDVATIREEAFSGCNSITSVTISNSVTNIKGGAFQNCSNITTINLGDGVTTIGDNAFSNCSSLTNIEIPSSITSIGENAFSGCSSLIYTNYADGCYLGNVSNPYLIFCKPNKEALSTITIHNNCKYILSKAFNGYTSLTSIEIPNGVTSIGKWAFSGCYNLSSLTLPNSVTSIERGAFDNCRGLGYKSLTIPDEVTYIGNYAFYNIVIGPNLVIPNSVTSIGEYAFYGSSITTLKCSIKTLHLLKQTSTGISFSNIETLILTGGTVIDADLCRDFSSVSRVTLPDTVTTIEEGAFRNCSQLGTVVFPSSLTVIGEGAFYGSRLGNINIPNWVTHIGYGAFDEDSSVSSIQFYYNGYLSDIMEDTDYIEDVLTNVYYSQPNVTPTFIDLNDDSQDIPWSDFFGGGSGSGSGSGSGY